MSITYPNNEISLIVLGNPGSGKSFLLNCLLERERFVHRISPDRVTSEAETEILDLKDGRKIRLWNLPGIIEPRASSLEHNLTALKRAFLESSKQIVAIVLQHQGGRLRHEDLELFIQAKRVWNLTPEATILLLNGASSLSSSWASQALSLFKRITDFEIKHWASLHRVPRMGKVDFTAPKACLNASLIKLLVAQCLPKAHHQTGEMEFEEERLQQIRREMERIRLAIRSADEEHRQRMTRLDEEVNLVNLHLLQIQQRCEAALTHHQQQLAHVEEEMKQHHDQHLVIMNELQQYYQRLFEENTRLIKEAQAFNAQANGKKRRGPLKIVHRAFREVGRSGLFGQRKNDFRIAGVRIGKDLQPIAKMGAITALTACGVPPPVASGFVTAASGGNEKQMIKSAVTSFASQVVTGVAGGMTNPLSQVVVQVGGQTAISVISGDKLGPALIQSIGKMGPPPVSMTASMIAGAIRDEDHPLRGAAQSMAQEIVCDNLRELINDYLYGEKGGDESKEESKERKIELPKEKDDLSINRERKIDPEFEKELDPLSDRSEKRREVIDRSEKRQEVSDPSSNKPSGKVHGHVIMEPSPRVILQGEAPLGASISSHSAGVVAQGPHGSSAEWTLSAESEFYPNALVVEHRVTKHDHDHSLNPVSSSIGEREVHRKVGQCMARQTIIAADKRNEFNSSAPSVEIIDRTHLNVDCVRNFAYGAVGATLIMGGAPLLLPALGVIGQVSQ
jgi:hypothetical protein